LFIGLKHFLVSGLAFRRPDDAKVWGLPKSIFLISAAVFFESAQIKKIQSLFLKKAEKLRKSGKGVCNSAQIRKNSWGHS
jgi:hypothetical protein